MKPEETDRYIQQLLQELDSIPDMQWNEARVWNKIAFRLRFAWVLKLLPVCCILTIAAVYICWPREKQQVLPKIKTLPEQHISANHSDSITSVSPQKDTPKKKYKKRTSEKNTIAIQHESSPEKRAYRLKNWRCRPVAAQIHEPVKRITAYPLRMNDIPSAAVDLRMPHVHLINMSVNNSFNTKNLIRSLGNNSNTYYRYKYDNYYVPEPFNTTIHMQQPSSHPQIIQYP